MSSEHSNLMITPLIRIVVVVALAAFVGCASGGSSEPAQLATKIKKGMTREQVRSIAGNPTSRSTGNVLTSHHTQTTSSDLDEVWMYSDGAVNLIPIVGLVRGARTNSVQVGFQNGRVSQIGESSSGLW